MAKLRDASQAKLSVLCAPPGYGKTTLLAQWAACRASAGARVRWISLTPEHGALQFISDLHLALGSRSCASRALRSMQPPEAPMPVGRVSDVLDALGAIPPTTVVIDNFHLLTDRDLLTDLGVALAHASPDLHVVIATRT